MVALAQSDPAAGPEPSGWQNIRHQLFGQQRERDAEDGLLTVITQLQTRLAAVTGADSGPLRAPAARAQALRAIQYGLNGVMAWHREQLAAGQVAGLPGSDVPDLAPDVVAAVAESHTLFEGASVTAGKVDAADVISGVSQLRGAESDAYFNEVLSGLLTMLQAVYVRIGMDAPTSTTAISLQDIWDILVEELRSLECPLPEAAAPVAELLPLAQDTWAPPSIDMAPTAEPETVAAVAEEVEVRGPIAPVFAPMAVVIYPVRFHRFELVAC